MMADPPRPTRPIRLASLKGETAFRRVRAHGQTLRTPLYTLRITDYRPRHGQKWQPQALIGIVVPKKTLRLAVDRNRARRRVREALRRLSLPACRAVLMPNPAVLTVGFEELQRTLAHSFGRVDLRGRGARGNAGPGGRVPEGVPPASAPTGEDR